jgi:hypothetical protein
MSHFVLQRAPDCLKALDHHDLAGVEWGTEPEPHFSGNFWWATSDYLKTLPEPSGNPELWVGQNQPRVRNFYNTNQHLYREKAQWPVS